MNEKERREIMMLAIGFYGQNAQISKAIEEFAELTQALCKLQVAGTRGAKIEAMRNIVEEMADSEIMHRQLKMMLHVDTERVIDEKLIRLESRINKAVESWNQDNGPAEDL